jgi:Chaperone of endosialidase/Secretion system C-terminal sorting domain
MESNSGGNSNVAVGFQALSNNLGGDLNTAIGTGALLGCANADSNTAIGAYANVSNSSITRATAVGHLAIVDQNRKVRIGSTTIANIEGQVAFSYPSDGRFKSNIREDDIVGLAFIQKLRPVVYNFDTRRFTQFLTKNMPDSLAAHYLADDFGPSTAIRQSGFIAQEVEQAAKEVGYDFNGVHVPADENDNYSLAYAQFVVPLVKGMQEQQAMIETRDAEVEALKSQLAAQQAQLQELSDRVQKMAQTCCPGTGTPAQGGTKADAPATGAASDPATPAHPVEVFPNPSLGRFSVRIAPLETGHFEVFDQRGVQVHRQALAAGQTEYTIDLSGQAVGSYLLRLHSHCGVVATKQLVVQ